jgi:hypothetical protein
MDRYGKRWQYGIDLRAEVSIADKELDSRRETVFVDTLDLTLPDSNLSIVLAFFILAKG